MQIKVGTKFYFNEGCAQAKFYDEVISISDGETWLVRALSNTKDAFDEIYTNKTILSCINKYGSPNTNKWTIEYVSK